MIGAAGLAVLGCGSSPTPRVDIAAPSRLHQTIAQVRASAQTGDRTEALRALSSLSRLVTIELDARHLTAADAAALKSGIARARQRIRIEIPAPAAPVTAPAPAPAPPAAPRPVAPRQPGHGKHAGAKGKGKGHKR